MAAIYAARVARGEPMSQSESDSDSESDNEDFSDAPNMQDFITASAELKELNNTAKALKETIKRKRDELEDYMIGKDAKYMRLDGMTVLMKKSKKLSWTEKALREHVDDDGKLDLDEYKNSQTQVIQKMTIKLQ